MEYLSFIIEKYHIESKWSANRRKYTETMPLWVLVFSKDRIQARTQRDILRVSNDPFSRERDSLTLRFKHLISVIYRILTHETVKSKRILFSAVSERLTFSSMTRRCTYITWTIYVKKLTTLRNFWNIIQPFYIMLFLGNTDRENWILTIY